jgi:head-tail adaptor
MIGNLNQRAQLLANTLTPDGGGGFADDWEAFASVWIALIPLGGSDAFGPDRLETRVRHRIALRRRGDVAAGSASRPAAAFSASTRSSTKDRRVPR